MTTLFQPLAPEQALPEAKERLEKAEQVNGFRSNLLGVLAHSPQALEMYQEVSQINARSSLSIQEREVVQLVAATDNGCSYCVAGHTALAKNKAKLPEEVVTALRNQENLPDARLDALSTFARHTLATKGAAEPAQIQAFLDAGFTEQNALDVILGLALATLCNYANSLARTELNVQLSAHAWTKKA